MCRLHVLWLLAVMLALVHVNISAEAQGFIFRGDIYQVTDVISDRGYHTVVPKRCILHTPRGLEGKKVSRPIGKFLLFEEFYKKNQTWLFKVELGLSEVRGEVPVNKDKMSRLSKLGKIVIAVHKGHPISVVKYAAPEPEIVEIRK